MPRRTKRARIVSMRIHEHEYQALSKYATDQNDTLADTLRDAMREHIGLTDDRQLPLPNSEGKHAATG